MRSLKSIRLINFQSHRNTLINFAGQGYLTVITGPSDSGKSAVIRALRWVFYNVPQGDGFIFNAEDKCTVALEYDDGTKVERIRSRGGINRYVVNGQTFEGFGTGVPLEVQQATGIRKLEIGDQSFLLNLSEQLDGPFLGKSVSGPARAKVLGKLAGTEEIDYASSEIKTDIYRAKRQQEDAKKSVEDKQKQLSQYEFIPSWERAVAKAETVLTETKDKVTKIEQLKNLSAVWKDLNTKSLALKNVINGLQDIDKALQLAVRAQADMIKGNTLTSLHSSHLQASVGRKRSGSQVKNLSNLVSKVQPLVEITATKTINISKFKEEDLLFEGYSGSISRLQKSLEKFMNLDLINKLLRQAFEGNVQLSKIDMLSLQHEDSSLLVSSFRGKISSLSGIDQADFHMRLASQSIGELSQISEIREQWMSLARNTVLEKQRNEHLAQDVANSESMYFDFMESLGKCPTCGGDINVEKLREVI